MKVYVLQEISIRSGEEVGGSIIGVYTTRWLAKLAMQEMSSRSDKKDNLYDIVPLPLDTLPIEVEEYEEAIESLIKSGLVEALVGEDGLFYYVPTDMGKREGKRIMKRLRRNDRKKGGD